MKKGFTLIELLVVVAVIGILATTIIMGLGGAKKPARDARRAEDLKTIQAALEIYYSKNSQYPANQTCDATGWSAFKTSLTGAGIGISKVPDDPLSSQLYCYCAQTGQQSYGLSALLEDAASSLMSSSVAQAQMPCTFSGRTCATDAYCLAP